ncbi:IclR family transcriptional regulator domain-containing protein [Teichococcus aestuarii]|uniref:IclR family transcriptional regulator domain-containing protein n=1 Tax=Teichococcus aestuarii TaxID=568898 RepID=UPI003610FE0E
MGYLERLERGGWQLGPAALRLGLSRLAHLDIRSVAAPLMRALSEAIDLPVDLAMPVGDEMLHFELAQMAGQVVVASEMGARLPIARTALGHAALFAMERRQQAETLERLRQRAGAAGRRSRRRSGTPSHSWSGRASASSSASCARMWRRWARR